MHYLFFAEGFEEIEALTPVDVLRRAGLEIKTVSITGNRIVTGAHGIALQADLLFEETTFSDADYLILPGGMPGTLYLGAHTGLCALLRTHASRGGRLSAICAAPSVLGNNGLLYGKNYTCYPGCEKDWQQATKLNEGVVEDGGLITAAGPGQSLPFALRMVECLLGKARAQEIAAAMIF